MFVALAGFLLLVGYFIDLARQNRHSITFKAQNSP
jgi:hypothetical protein